MFECFPDNYAWSLAVMMAESCGAWLGDIAAGPVGVLVNLLPLTDATVESSTRACWRSCRAAPG